MNPFVIAISHQKGGVAKTTTASALGAALVELGYRVLLIDLDPSGNLTAGLGYRFSAASEFNGSLTVAPKTTVTNGDGVEISHRQLNLQLMYTHRF